MILKYEVDKIFNNIKEILKVHFEISDRLLLKLKRNNRIKLNGKVSNVRDIANIGDIIEIDLDFDEDNSNIVPTKMNLDILYEDDSILILNKPPFTPIHPSCDHYEDSLSNGVRYYFDHIGLKRKIRPVNRLDKDTSGIVIFAKNDYSQECLVRQMKQNIFKKYYFAIVTGDMSALSEGTIDAPIARKENSIIERCVDFDNGDRAVTHYKFIKKIEPNSSLIECKLETGRTHQIRVHLAYIGFPIFGDTLYGTKSEFINRQALHAYKIEFNNPITKKHQEIINWNSSF